jgi:hypothetical protein
VTRSAGTKPSCASCEISVQTAQLAPCRCIPPRSDRDDAATAGFQSGISEVRRTCVRIWLRNHHVTLGVDPLGDEALYSTLTSWRRFQSLTILMIWRNLEPRADASALMRPACRRGRDCNQISRFMSGIE